MVKTARTASMSPYLSHFPSNGRRVPDLCSYDCQDPTILLIAQNGKQQVLTPFPPLFFESPIFVASNFGIPLHLCLQDLIRLWGPRRRHRESGLVSFWHNDFTVFSFKFKVSINMSVLSSSMVNDQALPCDKVGAASTLPTSKQRGGLWQASKAPVHSEFNQKKTTATHNIVIII